jgi:hypothetical protein
MNCDLRLSDGAGTTLPVVRCSATRPGAGMYVPLSQAGAETCSFGLAVGRSSPASTGTPRSRPDRDATTVVEQKDLI